MTAGGVPGGSCAVTAAVTASVTAWVTSGVTACVTARVVTEVGEPTAAAAKRPSCIPCTVPVRPLRTGRRLWYFTT